MRAEREEIEERLARVYGNLVETDPTSALLQEIGRTSGHVAWLQARIAAFESESDLKQLDRSGGFERPAVWLEIYQRERAHLARVSKMALDAGIAERFVRVAERQGELLASVMRAILDDPALELSPAQRALAPSLVRRHLVALAPSPSDT